MILLRIIMPTSLCAGPKLNQPAGDWSIACCQDRLLVCVPHLADGQLEGALEPSHFVQKRVSCRPCDLRLESSDDTIVSKILLDAARNFNAIQLEVDVSEAGIGTRI
jgi:hypothetical protein